MRSVHEEGNDDAYDRTAAGGNAAWAGSRAGVITVGRDLVLNPPQAGAPLNTFGYPYAEVGGKVLDFYEAKSFVYRISYREK